MLFSNKTFDYYLKGDIFLYFWGIVGIDSLPDNLEKGQFNAGGGHEAVVGGP